MLEKAHNILLVLLRAGLWERKVEDLSMFPLTDREWEDVFRLAVNQTVTGIVFEGLQQLPAACLPSEVLLARWVVRVDCIERQNCRMNQVLKEMNDLFNRNGIRGVLQKGQGVAAFYEQPLLRECGDIDFYFHTREEVKSAVQLMKRCGCLLQRSPDNSYSFTYKKVPVEFHSELLDLFNPFRKAYRASLIRKYGFQRLTLGGDSDGFSVPVPAPELNLLLLGAHMFKHLSGYGLGLRQFCDMARACYKLQNHYNKEDMQTICRKTGIDRWLRQLNTVLVVCLGLPADCLPFPAMDKRVSEKLLDIVFRGGNFGENLRRKKPLLSSSFRKKWQTGWAFGRHIGFSSAYAPLETVWMLIYLILGQRHERILL